MSDANKKLPIKLDKYSNDKLLRRRFEMEVVVDK
jgi:hypothetical protein